MREEMRWRWNHRVRGKAVEKAGKRLLLLLAAAIVAVGCSTTRVVEVPRVHTEYVYRTDTFVTRDSIRQTDSVYVQMKGDTLLIERWKTAYRDRTHYKVKVDSVTVTDTLTQVVKVEKELSHWQKTKLRCFPYLFCVFVGACLVLFYRLWQKFR